MLASNPGFDIITPVFFFFFIPNFPVLLIERQKLFTRLGMVRYWVGYTHTLLWLNQRAHALWLTVLVCIAAHLSAYTSTSFLKKACSFVSSSTLEMSGSGWLGNLLPHCRRPWRSHVLAQIRPITTCMPWTTLTYVYQLTTIKLASKGHPRFCEVSCIVANKTERPAD